jgi:hypothetical protein
MSLCPKHGYAVVIVVVVKRQIQCLPGQRRQEQKMKFEFPISKQAKQIVS